MLWQRLGGKAVDAAVDAAVAVSHTAVAFVEVAADAFAAEVVAAGVVAAVALAPYASTATPATAQRERLVCAAAVVACVGFLRKAI